MNRSNKKFGEGTHDRALEGLGEGTTHHEGKPIRKINPLGMRVVVQLHREGNRTDSGLYLPEGSKESMAESLLARVVEVASAVDDESHQETNISGIPLDALVLIPQKAGVRVPWDDDLRIIETKEVLAIVHQISVI